jgi:hypothetical protein
VKTLPDGIELRSAVRLLRLSEIPFLDHNDARILSHRSIAARSNRQ